MRPQFIKMIKERHLFFGTFYRCVTGHSFDSSNVQIPKSKHQIPTETKNTSELEFGTCYLGFIKINAKVRIYVLMLFYRTNKIDKNMKKNKHMQPKKQIKRLYNTGC